VRLDSHVVTGYRVPPNYDSMVAKLLVHQPTRAESFAVMRRALREFVVEGIHTTIPILKRIFDTPEFICWKVDTTFIERTLLPAKKAYRLWYKPMEEVIGLIIQLVLEVGIQLFGSIGIDAATPPRRTLQEDKQESGRGWLLLFAILGG